MVASANASEFYDALETRSADEREQDLAQRLPRLIARAQQASGLAEALKGVDPWSINSRAALASLPVLRKSDLKALQEATPPFGGLTATPVPWLGRLYMSPGPIFDPEGRGEDWWKVARALYAAGVRAGDVIQNCFSYHFTPAAFMVEGGARKIGCPVIPAGTGQTEQQLEAMRVLQPAAYTGTPSFLRILIEKAKEAGMDVSHLRCGLVAGEALPPSLRQWLLDQGLQRVLQWYGTADLGLVAYESSAMQGMIIDEDVLVEIVRPGTGDPVAEGEVGEVVVTRFNDDYPLVRFGTGDLSAVLPGTSPCGRTNMRIKGWMGRADQTTKVRGMFVHPGQVAEVLKRFPQVKRARLVVSGEMANDQMLLRCEVDGQADGLPDQLAAVVRDVTKLRSDIELVAVGSLPNDGKVIEDARTYA